MGNIATINLDKASFNEVDDILVNANGAAGRITKTDFLGAMNDWSAVTNKPFESFDTAYFRTKERADGADILTITDSFITSLESVKSFAGDIKNIEDQIVTLKTSSHTHDNQNVIDLFTISDSKLMWNGTAVGSDYKLPIATISEIGGVKPDGTTITVDSDGTIHGASQGLDFSALTAALTTGIQSGINITADTENNRFNFEVTGVPAIAIDSDGYWTVNGERGENPTKAQGAKGEDGTNGTDGVSPTVTATLVSTGVDITIIDVNGTQNVGIRNGTDGENGKSAYQSAVDNGYVGTEEEWVNSLHGADGVTTIQTEKVDKTCTFLADGWSSTVPYTQTVAVDGVTEALNPRIDVIISDNVATGKKEETDFSYFTRVTTGDGILTAYCYETKPTVDLNIMIEVI